MHAFTCAGMNTSQYICFCDFAGIRIVVHSIWYAQSLPLNYLVQCLSLFIVVYKSQKYIETVSACVDLPFTRVVGEVQVLPEYSEFGEVLP